MLYHASILNLKPVRFNPRKRGYCTGSFGGKRLTLICGYCTIRAFRADSKLRRAMVRESELHARAGSPKHPARFSIGGISKMQNDIRVAYMAAVRRNRAGRQKQATRLVVFGLSLFVLAVCFLVIHFGR